MREEFLMSDSLLKLIGEYGWNLYEVTNSDTSDFDLWIFESQRPTSVLYIGSEYVLLPNDIENLGLSESYDKRLGLEPAIISDFTDENKWLNYGMQKLIPSKMDMLLFSRMEFKPYFLSLQTPQIGNIDFDYAYLDYSHVMDTFRNEFKIVSKDDIAEMMNLEERIS